ncbi:uncharacterized protein G2W53_001127 [Senna tora]|uniref:Uncharacterized protein n=1 Tax=Senna tora TaxID=362788 RepID=A0A834XH90_9FABA|nr:uncharacterized protein G2W53_001127 [Senna tora]
MDPPIVVPSPPTIAPSPTALSPPISPSPPIAPSPHSFVHSNPQHDNEEPQIDNEQPPHLYGRSWGKDPTDDKTWIYPDKKTFVLYCFLCCVGFLAHLSQDFP